MSVEKPVAAVSALLAPPRNWGVRVGTGESCGLAEAFSQLFVSHAGAVFAYLCRLTSDPALAEDLTQETFLIAYRNLPALDPEGVGSSVPALGPGGAGGNPLPSLRPWLLRVARNLAISDHRRSYRRQQPVAPETIEMIESGIGSRGEPTGWFEGGCCARGVGFTGEDPLEIAVRHETLVEVRRVVQTLAPRYREPLLLYYAGDLTYAEISEVLYLPLGTVATRLRRGLALVARGLSGSRTLE